MTQTQIILRQQAWDYFSIVATQRLTVLNFYIALSSLLAGIQFAILQYNGLSSAGMFLGFLLVFLSYVFWKWDKRSSDMIKITEEILKHFEDLIKVNEKEPYISKVFHREEHLTNQKRATKSIFFWRNYYTYRTCLNLIFSSFALAGIFGIVMHILRK